MGCLGHPHFPWPFFKLEVKGGGTHCVGRVTGRTVWYVQVCGDAVIIREWKDDWMCVALDQAAT